MAIDLNPLYGLSTRQLYAVREQEDGRCFYVCCQRMFSFTSPDVFFSCGNCGYEIRVGYEGGPLIPKECPTCYCYLQYR